MNMNSIVFKLIALFIAIMTIAMLSLSFLYIYDSQKMTSGLMEDSLNKLLEEKKAILDLNLEKVENQTIELGFWLTKYFKEENSIPPNFSDKYFRDTRGILSNNKKDNMSSIYLSSRIALTEDIKKDIIATEKNEENFARLLKSNANIVCTYVITNDGLLRVYPYLENATFETDHNFNVDTYYEIALEKNNPEHKAVWTKPYNDWAGRGWVVTCTYPIYIDGVFKGVVCSDVTLEFLQKATADFKVAQSGFGFLLDHEGNIIYHPHYIPQAKEKGEVLNKSMLLEIMGENYKAIIGRMLEGKRGFDTYYNYKTRSFHFIAYSSIERLGWGIGVEVDRNEYIVNFKDYLGSYLFLSLVIIVIIAVFGSLSFQGISKPIINLSRGAQKIASGQFGEVVDIRSRDEIGVLAQSFNTMSLTVKAYMENLLKSKTQLETVLNSIRGFLSIRRLDYGILMVNSSGQKLALEKGREIIGQKCYEYFEGRTEPCEDCPMAMTIASGKEAFSEMVFGDKVFHVWSFPVYNSKNMLEEIVVYSTDVTEKIVLEKEFYQKEKLAGIGQIAAGIMHELKNPLSIMKGSSYLLKEILREQTLDKEAEDEMLQALKEIEDSIQRSEKITYNLLDFSRRSDLKYERIDIGALIEQILILEKKIIVEHDVRISVGFPPKPFEMWGISDSMKQVFLNLINNALNAMPKGGYLKIFGTELKNENKIRISITDTGTGIPEALQDKIFNPFFTTKPRGLGTGIGLWIVKNEIQKHGGEIHISSNEGEGTRVIITLPVDKCCDEKEDKRFE